jgi:hypothetical protein
MSRNGVQELGPNPTNSAAALIAFSEPYIVHLTIEGSTKLIMHRWNVEAVEEKARAKRGSAAKKTDDTESYLYRNEKNHICVPGEYLRMSIVNAAKYMQDPRSPRKSAMDLFKAGVIVLTELAPVLIDGKPITEAHGIDRRRAIVNHQGITRSRPFVNAGYQLRFDVQVILPEYIPRDVLAQVTGNAGRLVGIGEIRPSYGRFFVVSM